MALKNAIQQFEARLDKEYLSLFQNGELLKKGATLDFHNLNGTFSITVLHYDGNHVTFIIDIEKRTVTFTLDNFYIFNKKHVKELVEGVTTVYHSSDFNYMDIPEYEGVYIIHDEETDKIYVGQAQHVMWRIKDHLLGEPINIIDKRMQEGASYTIRTIPLADSGYSSLDALETALISYFNSYHTGYNRTRGNNGPGGVQETAGL